MRGNPYRLEEGELTGSRCAVITVWTKGVRRRRETEAEMPRFNAGWKCLWVCIGDRKCGCKNEVKKKLGTSLTVTWELGMGLRGQPRDMLNRSLRSPFCRKSSLPPLPWVLNHFQVCVHTYSCTMMLSCNMSLSVYTCC